MLRFGILKLISAIKGTFQMSFNYINRFFVWVSDKESKLYGMEDWFL